MTSLNGVRKRRLTAKETSIANCEVLDEKYRIAVQGIFSVHRLVVCLRFLEKIYQLETGVLTRWLFAFVFKDLCTENRGKLPRKISSHRKNRDFSILNSRAPSQNNKTSRTSCCRLFKNFLPSKPTEVTFEIQEVKCDCTDCFNFSRKN